MKFMSLVALLLSSCLVYSAETLKLDVDNQKNIFVISLPANPSTGYQWTLDQYDKSLFRFVKSHYQPAKKKMIGAGGVMQFKFILREGKKYPDKTAMHFHYARSWEKNGGTSRSVEIDFKPMK